MDYFDYGPWNAETSTDFDLNRFLEQSQKNEEERLEKELRSIEDQLSTRETLRDETLDDLQSKLDWYLERLELVYQRPGTQKQERLKRRITEFYREIRLEKRNSWLDIQELERDKRELKRELDEFIHTGWISELLDQEPFQ